MSHMPFARRYRPQKFEDVLGQEQTVSALCNSLMQKKTAHAYLFCGTRGCGKTTLARLLSKAVNCELLNNKAESCNRCGSCLSIQTSSHLDVIEIDGASHRGIDDIRQINETVGFQPSAGKFKVFIIDEVHMLTKEAFNALLKTLEEPPATVKFIFATTEPHKVPATILSRCLRFQLKRIPVTVIQKRLSEILTLENVPFEVEALLEIAARAEGSLRDSLSLLDQVLAFQPEKVSYQAVQELLGLTTLELIEQYEACLASESPAMALQFVQTVLETGMEASYFIEQLQLHTRLLLSVRVKAETEELTSSKRVIYEKIANNYTDQDLAFILDFLNQSLLQSKQYLQPKLHLEVMMLHLIRKPWLFSIDNLLKRLNELENRLQGSVDQAQAYPSSLSSIPKNLTDTPQSSFKSQNAVKSPVVTSNSSVDVSKAVISTSQSPQATPADLFQPAHSKGIPAANSPKALLQGVPNSTNAPSTSSTTKPAQAQIGQMAETLAPGRYEGLIHFAAKELGGHLR